MAGISREIARYYHPARELLILLRAHNDHVLPKLRALYDKVRASGGPAGNEAEQLEADMALLEIVMAEALDADNERNASVDLRVFENQALRRHALGVRAILKGQQSRLRSVYTAAFLRRAGLATKLPRDPRQTLDMAEGVHRLYLSEEIEWSAPRTGLKALKRGDLAAELAEPIQGLKKQLKSTIVAAQEADNALASKTKALELLARVFLGVLRRSEASYRMAGEDEAAELMRRLVPKKEKKKKRASPKKDDEAEGTQG